jgi:hypothetical protein
MILTLVLVLVLVQRIISAVEQRERLHNIITPHSSLTTDFPSGKQEAVRVVSLRGIPAPESSPNVSNNLICLLLPSDQAFLHRSSDHTRWELWGPP